MILFWDQRIRTIYSYVRKTVVQPVMKKDTIYKRSANIIWEILSMFLDMVQLLSDLTILTHFRGYKMAKLARNWLRAMLLSCKNYSSASWLSVFYMVGMLALNWLRDCTKASFWPRKGISPSRLEDSFRPVLRDFSGPRKKAPLNRLKESSIGTQIWWKVRP